MTAEWGDIKRLFAAAMEVPAAEREALIDARSGGDAALAAEVRSLVEAAEADGAGTLGGGAAGEDGGDPETRPGAEIGPYRLMELIGHGGFGSVFVAEQVAPVKRRVALKIIRRGLDSREVLARFEAERQALAMMDHPNIAKVYGAGSTPSGRPWLAMELVRGVPITTYCDEHGLNLRERLGLFVQVCRAVGHAHQKGVIHRDLKPGNVLVMNADGVGVVKAIDFGIAKALGERLTDRTVYTEFRQLIGTPAYMSPEQAGQSDLDIDTRSDIYSLGVLLYELLTGTTPFDKETLASAALVEVQRMICEVEPPRPSTRLETRAAMKRTKGQGEAPSGGGAARAIRGDLDWVVMKCLEKQRTRRYDTAGEVAAELELFLADLPVKAGPPSVVYRLSKFMKRHRAGVAAGTVAIVGLGLGLAFAGYAFVERGRSVERAIAAEREQAKEAERALAEAENAKATREFLREMVTRIDPLKGEVDRDLTVRAAIDAAAAQLEAGSLSDRPGVEASVRFTIGRMLSSLGEFDAAEKQLRRSVEMLRATDESGETLAEALSSLTALLAQLNRPKEAEPFAREALALTERVFGEAHVQTALAMHNLAAVLGDLGDAAGAEAMYTRALGVFERAIPTDRGAQLNTLSALGMMHFLGGKSAAAEKELKEAVEGMLALKGEKHPDVAVMFTTLGMIADGEGRSAEAEAFFRKALAAFEAAYGPDHPRIAGAATNLSYSAMENGKADEAEVLLRRALVIRRKSLKETDPSLSDSVWNLARLLEKRGTKSAEIEALLREALAMRRAIAPEGNERIANNVTQLGKVVLEQERFAEAEPLLVEAVALRDRSSKDGDWRRGDVRSALGACLMGLGKLDEAGVMLEAAFAAIDVAGAPIDTRRVCVERLVQLADKRGDASAATKWRKVGAQAAESP